MFTEFKAALSWQQFSIKHALGLDFFPGESEGATHDPGRAGGSDIFFSSHLPLFHLERPSPPEKMKRVKPLELLLTERQYRGVNGEGDPHTHSVTLVLSLSFFFLPLLSVEVNMWLRCLSGTTNRFFSCCFSFFS